MRKAFFADKELLPVLSVIVVCTLPHLFNISAWSVMACLAIWGYSLAAVRYSWHLPGRGGMLLLVSVFFLIAMATNEGFTIEAFVALLALMIPLKLLDIQRRESRMTTVILCYFLIVGSLFFDDSIFATAYMMLAVLCTTAVLMHVSQLGSGIRFSFGLAGKLLLQALPIMLVLFLLFPRIQGGVWGRAPISTARTGFTDRMAFGDMARLARNTDVAFRVAFDGSAPAREKLYWRGVVLWEFDGSTWYRGGGGRGPLPRRSESRQEVHYTLTLEPHNERWLITLDLPMRVSLPRTWLLGDFSYYRWRPITQRVSYEGTSFLDAHDFQLESIGRRGTELPAGINPRTTALAAKLYREAGSTREYIDLVLRFFSEEPFSYTLSPPPLTSRTGEDGKGGRGDFVDAFLFGSRQGFCEHYATAFTFLMRAAGVPSRVVVGYLGGTFNPYGDYLVVRQSQAHAWSEVWIEGEGWLRVDATASVAPSRVSGEGGGAASEEELVGLLSYFLGTPLEPWLLPAAEILDLVNSRWNRWVMGYSVFEQVDLFSRFGINLNQGKGRVKAFLTALLVSAALVLVMSLMLLRRQRPDKDQPAYSWSDFCGKMARIGLEREKGKGPVDYMNFVLQQRPDLEYSVREIVGLYVQLRYAGNPEMQSVNRLQELVAAFRPQRSAGAVEARDNGGPAG